LPGDLTFRPAGVEVAAFIADLHTANFPQEPLDPLLVSRWLSDPMREWERFRVELEGRPIGYAFTAHFPWDRVAARHATVFADLLPERKNAELLKPVYEFADGRARASGAEVTRTYIFESDQVAQAVTTELGFSPDRRERYWELDLKANASRLGDLAGQSRARMREQALELLTFAEDPDPGRHAKTYMTSTEGELDVPRTGDHVPDSLEKFLDWLGSPGIHEDRIWIARDGDRVVGLSTLSYPPTRGIVNTDWTAVARSHRGRGVARALKLETLLQAIDLGVDRVRTDNDSANAPILHINAEMGYRNVFDRLWLMKR